MNDDRLLLEKLRRRDQQGLEEAISRYGGYVAAVVRRTLGPFGAEQDGEELVSDVFVTLWQKAESLRDDSSLKNWLGVVARNGALKRLGRIRLEEPLEDNLCFSRTDPAEEAEQRVLVRRAVNSLGRVDREILIRHYFWYETVEQIARETGMNPSTVKTRLRRGREKLRKKLEKEELQYETPGRVAEREPFRPGTGKGKTPES